MLRKSPFRTHSLTWLPGKSWRWSENFGKLDSGLEERLKTDDVESGSWWSRWSEVSKVLRPRTSTMAACTWGERASLTCSGTSAQSSRSLHTTWRVLESLPLHITGGKKDNFVFYFSASQILRPARSSRQSISSWLPPGQHWCLCRYIRLPILPFKIDRR